MLATTSRSRGAYSKTARRRGEILDAAATVFGRSGFVQASLADIAELAGISIAGLNHHFATKTHLLEGVFDRLQEETEARFASEDPLDLLRAAVDLAERGQNDPTGTRFFAVMSAEATSPEHPAHDYFLRRYTTTLHQVTASFEQLRSQGRLREGVDPEDAARVYIGLSDGVQIQALYQPGAFSQAALLRRMLNNLLTEPL
ncbi:TetR/AcrR family transcriptional regulator [Microbacterium sp. BH-3-3-3]|uniref:TetR/AcrR family transcriptional regulator n=1 Tax=Microbacterium sp. BH-3-3-3 TaxID=1906742 RepID=UPI00089295BD|nr:TetR/AcrR family transcriptional regulator [Microbacterium sp. BH-3-3-3]AOX45879.1 hypothetical protein BJP65_08700 [Microbacterium sp. BH-3-3-3]